MLSPNKTAMKDELFQLLKQLSFKKGHFILASGKASTIYMDTRMTTLSGRGSYLIGNLMCDMVRELGADAVGGMTMGADPIVTAITYHSALQGFPINGFLVRKEAKSHGRGRAVEGHLEPWMRVVLVEDVVTTGQSTLKAIEIIQAMYPTVQIAGVLAIVDREEGGRQAFEAKSVPFQSLYSVQAFLAE